MKLATPMLQRMLTGILAMTLAGIPEMILAQSSSPPTNAPSNAAQQQAPEPTAGTSGQTSVQGQSAPPEQPPVPDSPGTVQAQGAPSQSSSTQHPEATENPLGTAAAQIGNASGNAASKPAGIAIAPAKTHRSRSLLIEVGAVVGAAVALGTVMALSNSSPSRPPGATGASEPAK